MPGLAVIVMRTKDRPLLLRRALRSVLSQTHGAWRLVVVNDGGAPEPVNELVSRSAKALGDRVTVLHNPASVGMEAASNLALRAAEGDYAVIHDDDDSWEPTFLERTIGTLESLPANWGGVVTLSRLVRERIRGNRVEQVEAVEFNAELSQISIADLAAVNQFPPIAFLYRKSLLEEVGYYREELPVLGDWDFNLRFIQHRDIRVIREVLANWHHRLPEDKDARYRNSVHEQDNPHLHYGAMLRNEAIRADLATGRFGLGELMSRSSATLQELRDRLTKIEQERARAEAAEQHAVAQLGQAAQELAHAVHRERDTAVHVRNLEMRGETLDAHVAALQADRDKLLADRDRLVADRDALLAAGNELRRDNETLVAAGDELRRDKEMLLAAVDELRRDQTALLAHLDAARGKLAVLAPELASAKQQVQGLSSALAGTTASRDHALQRLAAIESSSSWRITAPLRRLVALASRIRLWVGPGVVRWRRHACRIAPLHDVREEQGVYVTTGHDPQLSLTSPRRRPPRELVLISWDGEAADGRELRPCLYVDAGNGFEANPIKLLSGHPTLHILPRVRALRLDPLEGEGGFRLDRVTITEVGRLSLLLYRAWHALRLYREEPDVFRRRWKRLTADGVDRRALLRAAIIEPTSLEEPYESWVRRYDTLRPADREQIRRQIAGWTDRPTISVVMPVYNPPIRWLKAAIASVQAQLYPHWELCIADDASTDPQVRRVLEQAARKDGRIKLCWRPTNGHISAASNSALELATGQFVALMDNDDALTEHAFYHVIAELQAHPEADILFSDEDKVDEDGRRFDPYFKPDWNPDLLLSQNMVGHLAVYRRRLLQDIGGFRTGFEGAQDHDLILRAAERTSPARIRHIPRVLYHWRSIPGSTALAGSEKNYAWEAGRRAIQEALQRRGVHGRVEPAADGIYYRVRLDLPEAAPRVSLFIPTRDRVDLLRNCVTTILERTDYPDIEILIVDNDSAEPETLAYFAEVQADSRVRVVPCGGPFNFSRLNNRAAQAATGQVYGLINNDIEVSDPDWLKEMVAHALRPEVGAVGAKLLYADTRVQHAGVVLGIGGVAGHLHRFVGRHDYGYFGRAAVTQNLSAVTAACLLLRRSVFEQVGGLDEQNLPVAFNDVDFCLRIRECGYLIVWTPFAELFHLESASRGSDETAARRPHFQREMAYMLRRWGPALLADPAFNPNLALDREQPWLAFPPRTSKPWKEAAAPVASPPAEAERRSA